MSYFAIATPLTLGLMLGMLAEPRDNDRRAPACERAPAESWNRAIAACGEKRDAATTTLVLGALNAMFDITTTRAAAARMHPPLVVFALLFLLAVASAFVAGHGMASAPTAPWLRMFTFAAMISASVYLVLDLEYSRAGFVRIDGFVQTLADLRHSTR